jgi:urate oxidase
MLNNNFYTHFRRRAHVDNVPHDHSFEHPGDERHEANVHLQRLNEGESTAYDVISLESSITNMTILKTTQSGFESM